MSDLDEIREILRAELELAKKNHEKAQAAFRAIAGDPRQLPRLPTGRQQLEGSEKFCEAFRAELEARERHLQALHRFWQSAGPDMDAPNEFRSDRARYQSTSWNRSRSRP